MAIGFRSFDQRMANLEYNDQGLIAEAFSKKDLDVVIPKLARVVGRSANDTLYRYGGGSYYQKFQKAGSGAVVGALFLTDSGKAIRFNWEASIQRESSSAITSVDVWHKDAWNLGYPKPSITINTEDMNIVQIIKVATQLLKNPGLKKVKLSEDFHITEAKRNLASVQQVINWCNQNSKKLNAVKVADLSQFVQATGMDWPPAIRSLKIGRGVFNLSNAGSIGDGPAEIPCTIPSQEKHPAHAVVKDLETKARAISVDDLFEDLSDLSTLVAKGVRPSLLVVGGAGTGKTFTVMKSVKKAGLKEKEDYLVVKGKTSTFGLYETLFLYHDKLVIFDDCDDVFASGDSRNLLKAALDSYDKRIISWNSKITMNTSGMDEKSKKEYDDSLRSAMLAGAWNAADKDAQKMPSEFEFKGGVIFISNIPKDKMEQAIISRSLTIDVTLSRGEMFERIELVMDNINPGDGSASREDKEEVLSYLKAESEAGNMGYPSMRTFVAGLEVKMSGLPRWKSLLQYTGG